MFLHRQSEKRRNSERERELKRNERGTLGLVLLKLSTEAVIMRLITHNEMDNNRKNVVSTPFNSILTS